MHREIITEPDCEQAENDGAHDIAAGLKPFAVLSEVERLQAEGREGGEAAEKSQHDELPHGRAGEDASVGCGQGGEDTDDERTRDVH